VCKCVCVCVSVCVCVCVCVCNSHSPYWSRHRQTHTAPMLHNASPGRAQVCQVMVSVCARGSSKCNAIQLNKKGLVTLLSHYYHTVVILLLQCFHTVVTKSIVSVLYRSASNDMRLIAVILLSSFSSCARQSTNVNTIVPTSSPVSTLAIWLKEFAAAYKLHDYEAS
jgi:hypothetical protein